MYTAQNLGFDTICVNYDNTSEQETICSGLNYPTVDSANCFGNISQTKLDYTGDCIHMGANWNEYNCGIDTSKNSNGEPYYVLSQYDAVIPRISTMLQYLCTNNSTYNNGGTTDWSQYLTPNCSGSPVWSKIILGGHSQGGDMATFAAYENSVSRVINLSAPPQATLIGTVMTAANYFTQKQSLTGVRRIFGLVSANDAHYWQPSGTPPTSVYQAVWQALGYNNPVNNDGMELLKTDNVEFQYNGLNCHSGTPSHNLATNYAISQGGGHADPTYIWNEDLFKFMLLASTN